MDKHSAPALTDTLMAFDFGHRRIGVAVGSLISGRAQPVASINHREHTPDWDSIEALAGEWQPARAIVGLPATLDGRETEMSSAARAFARQLGERLQLPVDLVDEQLSSAAARDELRTARAEGRKRQRIARADVDPVAARLILETWLNEQTIKPMTGPGQ